MCYFVFRQVTAALGLLSLGGHAQMIRPLIAPMAEAAAKLKFKNLTHKDSQKIKAFSAGTDNVAVFFGEDIFPCILFYLLKLFMRAMVLLLSHCIYQFGLYQLEFWL